MPRRPTKIGRPIRPTRGNVSAVVAAMRLMGHHLAGRSVGWYAVRGYTFFDAGQFAPSGRANQRVFLLAAVIFLLAVIAGIAIAFGSL